MSIRIAFALLFAGLLLGGCTQSSSDGIGPTNPQSGNGNPTTPSAVGVFRPNFVPLSNILPFPTDLYFLGSTDGTLNIPQAASLLPVTEFNALDGYSTVAPATVRFSAAIDPATISAASVIMLQVTVDNVTKATTPPLAPLVYGTDYTARVSATVDSGGSTLEIVPLRPLAPSAGGLNPGTGYLIVLTNDLADVNGNAATPDTDYLAIKNAQPSCAAITVPALNGLCLLTGAHLAIAGAVGVPAADVVLTFSFTAQATADTMNIAAALAQPTPIVAVQTPFTLAALGVPGAADIYVGSLEIPYYHDSAAPLSGSWQGAPFTAVPGATPTTFLTRFNPVPVERERRNIPLFVTVPNTIAKPGAGWPVVIFQHGLRGNRAQAVAIAGAYALQGFVVAAIDIPLHGITNDPDPSNIFLPLYAGAAERTFNLDLVNNATGAQGPDGIDDPSGSYIINLASLLTSRDNLRQAAIDIVQLATSLPGLDLDGGGPDIDGTRIHYSAISLGGIVGTVANAMPIATVSAYLNVPGGGVAYLLRDSDALSPTIEAGLAAQNPLLVPGRTLYEQFFRNAQSIVDAGDPVNYIARTVALRPVLLSQVTADTVVPNSATQRLVDAATFVQVSAPGPTPVAAGTGTFVHFTSGSHGSLLSPTASAAATTEMQTHAASLAGVGGGTFFVITPAGSALLEP